MAIVRRSVAAVLALVLVAAGGVQAWAQVPAPPQTPGTPPPGSAPAPAPVAPEGSNATPPRLSYLDGQVWFWRAGAEAWAPAELNTALAPGDELATGHPGNVELQVGPRAFVRAWGDTRIGVTGQTADFLRLQVLDGHVAVDVRGIDSGQMIQIDTPGGSFAVDGVGYYRVESAPDRTSFTSRRAGQSTITRVEGGSSQTSAAPELDAWDRWNQARTTEILSAASARYVGDGMYGAHELDVNGTWRVVPTYGAVWVPRGAPAGWAPYTTGRWVWDPRFGWTWVDTAVWGWAPYHYGRWVSLDGVWVWAPGPIVVRPVYAPALVAFFRAPGVRVAVGAPFVSWVALGWGEPIVPWWGRPGFIGHPHWVGWAGPRVVNNVVINKTTVVNARDIRVYRNVNVHRAVVAVPPERFGRGRVEDARVTQINAQRLEPVRGPLRMVEAPGARGEANAARPRVPDARERSREETPPPPRVAPRPPASANEGPRGPRGEGRPRHEGPQGQLERTPRAAPAARIDSPAVAPRVETPRANPSGRVVPSRPSPAPGLESPRPTTGAAAEPARPAVREREVRPRPALRDGNGPAALPRAAVGPAPVLRGAADHGQPGRGESAAPAGAAGAGRRGPAHAPAAIGRHAR
jgi:hypothetical protein